MIADAMVRRLTRRDIIAASVGLLAWRLAAGGNVAAQSATPSPESFPPFPELPPLPAATPREDRPLAVVTTTGILADLVSQCGGERVEVNSILPANADPHDFEPAPEDLIRIAEADLIVVHGLRLDAWAEPLIDSADASAPIVIATDGIETIASDEEEFSEGDPHVWFDPMRTKQMVANIASGLIVADGDGEADYQARQTAYAAHLDALDAAIAERIALIPAERRKIVTNHDSLAYYAARYGLEIVGTIIPGIDTRTEPSAKEIAELIDTVEREGVRAIFIENTASARLAESLAEQAGIEVIASLYTDNLGEPGSGAETYIGLMQTDTRIIVEALR
ncbi:MAG TPA: metal ABC transporter substrate-binding protein [Thermomicrobiales bacterium]